MARSLWKSLFGWAGRPDAESRRFGNYHLIKIVHDGEKAAVYQARSPQDGELYAIKAYKPRYNRIADRIGRRYHVRGEGEIGMSLNTPGQGDRFYPIVRTVSYGREFGDRNKCCYIVQEFIDGLNLKNLVGREGLLTQGLRFRIAVTVARGMGIIHNRGLIHRDLCTDNILIRGDGAPKLIDLGFMAPVGISFREQTGTPSYMSPEQFQAKPLHPASDIYAFGVVLFELFTGELPFKSTFSPDKPDTRIRRVSELMDKHVNEPPPRPSDVRPDIPDGLDGLILRCLAKVPVDRYGSVREILRSLSLIQEKEGARNGASE